MRALKQAPLLLLAMGCAAAPAAAEPVAQASCAAGDDQTLCSRVSEILPALLSLWDKPYRIPSDLPALQEKWKPVQKILDAPRGKNSKDLEDMLGVCAATLKKFPSADQYAFLAERAAKNSCWFQELLKAGEL